MAMQQDWMKLDTAAKIYPSISQTHNNSTFRLNVELYETVNKEYLQEALVRIMPRFPSFAVALKRGLFWYYLEHNDAIPIVKEESGFPCKRLKDFVNNGFLFNVTYYKSNIIMECFHGLADGTGAIEFLKTMLYEYFLLCGYCMDDLDGIVKGADGKVKANELEDSFSTYYEAEGELRKLKQPQAYHIMGTPLSDNNIYLVHGSIKLEDFKKAVKEKGVTVSAYVAALLIYSTYRQQGLSYRKEKKPIMISVPIDLRTMFPSNTLRNFVSLVNVGVKIVGEMRFDDILKDVNEQLKFGLSEGAIRAKINKNVKFEKNPFIRITPLFVKNIVVSNTYKMYGEGCYTMVLSNLKTTKFPKSMYDRIKNIYYALGVSDLNPLNCVVVSYRDDIVFTFARGIKETGIIREFFGHFSKDLHLNVKIRGNEWNKKK